MTIPVTLVNVGTNSNDNTGDPAQIAFTKINASLTSLSTNAGGGAVTVTSPDNSVVVTGSPGNTLALQIATAFSGAFNILPGIYTYATLPSAALNALKFAATSDQNAVFSNGVIWQILFNATQGVLAISSNSPLTSAQQSSAYSTTLTATGGIGALTWSLIQKTGTNTWALSTAGVLTGTPGTVETDYLVVQVSDSTGAVAQKTLALQTLVTLTPAATPTFSPVAGLYATTQSVTISCSTPSSTIYYTTNGSTPTTGSTVYTTPVSVAVSETLKAIATAAGFTQSAVGSAVYTIGGNLVFGGNYGAAGTMAYDGFPLFRNAARSAIIGTAANTSVPLASLTGAGWPASDFSITVAAGNTVTPSWATGSYFNCGFTGTTGFEVITGTSSVTISNDSGGGGSAGIPRTFRMTATAYSNIGFKVTGTSGGVTNLFAYLPAYNSQSGVDDPTLASAFTSDALNYYSKFSHLRWMQVNGAYFNTRLMTSANRLTPSNCKFQFTPPCDSGGPANGTGVYNLSALPANGGTSLALTNNWPLPTGVYGILINGGGGDCIRQATLTNGAKTCTWSGSDPLVKSFTNQYIRIGFETIPFEWAVSFANACGNSLWFNTPIFEDGVNGAAGTWSAAYYAYIAANWTSPGRIYIEDGNENWNSAYPSYQALNDFIGLSGLTNFNLYAQRRHTAANVARANLPAGWFGTRAFQMMGCQTVLTSANVPYNTLLAMYTNYGNPSADVQYIACAPYVTPVIGSADSIATIEATFLSTDQQALAGPGNPRAIEAIATAGLAMGAKGGAVNLATYEDGGQWNSVNSSNPNLGAAIMDSGMVSPLQSHYTQDYNNGVSLVTALGSGVTGSPSTNGGVLNAFQSVVNYAAFVANPASSSNVYTAVSAFFGPLPPLPTRNIVNGSGSVILGYNYQDNNSYISTTLPTLALGTNFYPHTSAGFVPYLFYCSTPGTFALAVTWSACSGSPTSAVEIDGTVLYASVALSNAVVAMGNVTLTAGWHYVCLGKSGAQTATINQLQFN